MSLILSAKTTQASRNRKAFILPSGLTPTLIAIPGVTGLPVNEQRGDNYLRRNFASVDADQMTIFGAPSYSEQYASLDAVSYASIYGHKEPHNATLLWIGEIVVPDVDFGTDSSYRPHLIGWGRNSQGFCIYPGTSTTIRASANFGNSSTLQTATLSGYAAGAIYNRRMLAARVEEGVGVKLFDLTAGTSATANNTAARFAGSSNEDFHIGSAQVGVNMLAGKGKSTCGLALMFDTALSDTVITTTLADWARGAWESINGVPADF